MIIQWAVSILNQQVCFRICTVPAELVGFGGLSAPTLTFADVEKEQR